MDFRRTLVIQEVLVGDQAYATALPHAIGGEGFFHMIVEHPQPLPIAVQSIVGGVKFQVYTLSGCKRINVSGDLRTGVLLNAVIMRFGGFVAMSVERQRFGVAVKDAQFNLFVRIDYD